MNFVDPDTYQNTNRLNDEINITHISCSMASTLYGIYAPSSSSSPRLEKAGFHPIALFSQTVGVLSSMRWLMPTHIAYLLRYTTFRISVQNRKADASRTPVYVM